MKNIVKHLTRHSTYEWLQSNTVAFRGFIYNNNECLKGSSAISYIESSISIEHPIDFLSNLNGSFSLIVETDKYMLLAVDRLRSLPLFYTLTEDEFLVGDDARSIVMKIKNKTLSKISVEEYLSTTLFVTGRDTLIKELYQVVAGSFCLFDKKNNKIEEIQYYNNEPLAIIDDIEILKIKFEEAYSKAGKNLVCSLDNRTAVVPLSGGADSRMILSMLHNEGYKKVVCFTYGKDGNTESKISQKVAKFYGYEWVMIPYTRKKWMDLRKNLQLQEYMKYSFSYTSTPHIQDYLAVKEMKELGILPEDSIFIPGHSGDLVAGSHITPEFLKPSMEKAHFKDNIFKKFYNSRTTALDRKIESTFINENHSSTEAYLSKFQFFNLQERQAKFIINSVRVYEFFGYEWLIPLWDNSIIDYWRHVPINLHYQRKLYFLIVDNTIESTNDITIYKLLAERVRKIPFLRNVIRRGTRILEYINSSLCINTFFPFYQYFGACLFGPPTSTVTYLLSQKMVASLKNELTINEN